MIRILTVILLSATLLPAAERRIVVLGSSTAAGVGASSTATSWVGLMTKALAGKGITVTNVSISGNNTADTIARFSRDVTPLHPDYVILGTSVINETILAIGAPAVVTYQTNLRTLIGMVDDIGAIPIVIGQYANAEYGPRSYGLIQKLYSDLENYGVPVWDFLSGTDDGTGRWLPGLSGDGTHPTDIGHRYMFDSIPLTVFDAPAPGLDASPVCTGSWTLLDRPTAAPVTAMLDRPAASWSIGLWVKGGPSPAPVTLMGSNASGLSLQASDGIYDLRQANGSVIVAPIAPGPQEWHQVFVTYNVATKLTSLYVDGRLAGDTNSASWPPLSSLGVNEQVSSAVGAPATGYSFSQLLIYRAPLPARDIQTIYLGSMLKKSLAVWLGLTCEPRHRVRNLAAGFNEVGVGGLWQWSPAEPPSGPHRRATLPR